MSINLAPKELLKESSFWRKVFRWTTTIGRVIIVGTQLVVLGAFLARFSLDRRLLDLSEKIKTKRAIITATSNIEENFRKTQDQLEAIKNIKSAQNQYSETLEEFAQRVPSSLTLEHLSLKDNTLALTAQAPSGEDFAWFLIRLFTWEDLSRTTLKSAKLSPQGGISFNLDLEINPESYRFRLADSQRE